MVYKLVLFIFTLSITGIVYESVHAQSHQISTDSDNNRSIIMGDIDESIEQAGNSNSLLIYSDRGSGNPGKFSGLQQGYLNRLFAFIGGSSAPLLADIDQTGGKNNIIIMQNGKKELPITNSDSLSSGANSINIKQQGNKNRATVIQNK